MVLKGAIAKNMIIIIVLLKNLKYKRNPCTQTVIPLFVELKKWNQKSQYLNFVFILNLKIKPQNNPCMESIIQKIDFLQNKNCIFYMF